MKLRLLLLPALMAVSLVPGVAQAAVSDPIDPAARVAATSWGTDRIDLFAKGTDGTLKHKVFNGRWSAWESLGGAITYGPAATSWGPGRIDVVARGTDGAVKHRSYSNGTWSGWTNLGGAVVGSPTISTWGSGRLDVFARGTDNAVYHKPYSSGAWKSSWTSLGGTVSSSPAAVSWDTNRIDVFVRGGSNALYQKTWAGSWSSWKSLGGTLTSSPDVVSGAAGFLDVYVRTSNNAIMHRGYGYGQWGSWENLGGSFATSPGVSVWGGGHTDVFARGTDGVLKQRTWHGIFGWEPSWRALPDAAATVPVRSYTRTVAMQASPASGALVGPLEYAYVDNIGRIVHGHQPDPANAGGVQWTVISGNEAFSGPPGLMEQTDKRLQVSAQHTDGDVWARAQTAQGASSWTGWIEQGGQLASAVTMARQTDGTLVVFAVDSAGGLWYLPQPSVSGPYGVWRSLGVSGLVPGEISTVAVRDGLQIFAVDIAGAVQTATLYPSGTVSAWTSLGGAGFTGTPAAVVYPGYKVRVFVRAGDGSIQTKIQDDAGAWPAEWSPVGSLVAAGSPAAVLSPLSGKTEVVVRTDKGEIWSTGETLQGSGVWRDWVPVLQFGDLAATDPTVLTYNDGYALRWAFLFRTADQQSRLYTVDTGMSALSAETLSGQQADTGPSFRATRLPAPPR